MYLGFLRESNAGISRALEPALIENFAASGSDAFHGESVGVFATASAAHDGFVRGLPYAGDYLRCWMMSIPHFLLPVSSFEPLNERFAHTYFPASIFTGMGWGFSFFGEAYAVGGYAVVVAASIAMMLLFRWLYVVGGAAQRTGLLGAISLSAIPYTFWFQRNALAYFVKEFLVYQIAVVLLVYASAEIVGRNRTKRPMLRRTATEELALPY